MTHTGILPFLCVALCALAATASERETPLDAEAAPRLEARGPGAVFASVEAAAVDALTYAHLQARAAGGCERVRGGAIRVSADGYSYDEIHVAHPLTAHRITYDLGPRDVARFVVYPRVGDHDVNRANERPSRVDRRSISAIDPLRRPLYVLHPSLAIRVYRGDGHERKEVGSLRLPPKGQPLLAGN